MRNRKSKQKPSSTAGDRGVECKVQATIYERERLQLKNIFILKIKKNKNLTHYISSLSGRLGGASL
jgi:hypothetical protein